MNDSRKPLTAGWYTNPEVGDEQYWDGAKWLDIPKPSNQINITSRTETSTLSVVALIAAFLIPVVGLILGINARKEIDRSNGAKTGRGMATASIWLGAVGTLGILIYIILVFLGGTTAPSGDSAQTQSSSYYDSNGLVQGTLSPEEAQAGAAGILYANENPTGGVGSDLQVSVVCQQAADSQYPMDMSGPDDGKPYELFANGCMTAYGKDPNYFKNPAYIIKSN